MKYYIDDYYSLSGYSFETLANTEKPIESENPYNYFDGIVTKNDDLTEDESNNESYYDLYNMVD